MFRTDMKLTKIMTISICFTMAFKLFEPGSKTKGLIFALGKIQLVKFNESLMSNLRSNRPGLPTMIGNLVVRHVETANKFATETVYSLMVKELQQGLAA